MEKFNQLLRSGEPYVLSIFRIMVGLSLFQFGVAKIFKFPLVAPFDKVAMFSLFWDAAVFEFLFGGLLILGLFSRLAAFILCGEMAFAYFMSHAPRGFFPILNGGELAVLYFACIYLGVVIVPINPASSKSDIQFVIGNCKPKLIVTDAAHIDSVREFRHVVLATHRSEQLVLLLRGVAGVVYVCVCSVRARSGVGDLGSGCNTELRPLTPDPRSEATYDWNANNSRGGR